MLNQERIICRVNLMNIHIHLYTLYLIDTRLILVDRRLRAGGINKILLSGRRRATVGFCFS